MLKHLHVLNIINYTYDFYIHDNDLDSFVKRLLNVFTKMELNITEKVCYK